MTCAACSARLERVLNRVDGVTEARVSLPLERADVRGTPPLDQQILLAAIESAGFHGVLRAGSAQSRHHQREMKSARRTREHRSTLTLAVLAGIVALPFLIDMILMAIRGDHVSLMTPWAQAGLAGLVQVVCGARFYRGAWSALRNGSANMDVLIALGTSAAFGLSLFNLASGHAGHGGDLYFEASVTVLAFVLFGKVLEGKARSGAGATLEALARAAPQEAIRLGMAGEVRMTTDALKPGDIVLIRPGALSPADGRIVTGTASFDEALMTGESLPVVRGPGDTIMAGSVASGGSVTVEVTATGEDTRLQAIARLIEDAEIARSPSQQLADRISAVFVPAVMLLAALTWAGWLVAGTPGGTALIHAVSVLVVACPCALGLATPIALVAGANAAARAGIIVTDHGALESAGQLSRIVFDKTGTLTLGRPQMTVLHTFGDPRRALAVAAALASRSDHPLDRILAQSAANEGLTAPVLADFAATPGSGLSGTIDGALHVLGNATFLIGAGVPQGAVDSALRNHVPDDAQSIVWLARPGHGLLAVFGFADQARPGLSEMLERLARLGIAVTVLSGDRGPSVAAFARRFAVSDARGDLKPDDKIRALNDLRGDHGLIAMVGDGINDTPALRAADVGIAMASGTEAAKAAASFTLNRSDLALIPKIVLAGKATRAAIGQNLALAFLFNGIGLPLAAAGKLSPALAGAAMACSSIAVVTNAWALARRRL